MNPNLRFAKLMGALPNDIQSPNDVRDARDIISTVRGLQAIQETLDAANQGAFTTSIRARGIIDRLWEQRRRRGSVLNGKFASGGLWSSEAASLAFTDDGTLCSDRSLWNGKLILEHVVPAKATVWIIEAMLSHDATDQEIIDALYDLCLHVVLTKEEDSNLIPKMMSPENVSALIGHYTKRTPLDTEERERVLWSRYPDTLMDALIVPAALALRDPVH